MYIIVNIYIYIIKNYFNFRNTTKCMFTYSLVILLGQIFGRRDTAGLLDLRVVKVPLDTLHQRLSHIPYTANYPWLTPE